MSTLKISIDRRRIKKDGTFPVILRIYHGSKYITVRSNISVHSKDWDSTSSTIKKSHPLYQSLNIRIKEMELFYSARLLELYSKNPDGFSISTLKDLADKKNVDRGYDILSVGKFWENEIDLLKKSKRFGNARVHLISLNVFKKEIDLEIPFEDIDYSFLKNLEIQFLSRGVKTNSIGVYMRNLRVIYNLAINKGIVEYSSYPFRRFKIKSEKVAPHVLTIEELQHFFQLNLTTEHPVYRTWMIAQLTFLLGGINFTDLCLLKHSNISNGRIIYTRSKTKKMYSVCLLPETREIIERISQPSTPTLLNILSADDLSNPERLPYIIRDKNKQFNKKLLKLSTLINCTVHIRSYTFRYSIANTCKRLGYDISLISELLGHSYGSSITSGYLMAYDRELLDEMLTKVTRLVAQNSNSVL